MYWSREYLLIIVTPFGFLMIGNATLHQLTIMHRGCRERELKKSAHIVNQHARKHVGGRVMRMARVKPYNTGYQTLGAEVFYGDGLSTTLRRRKSCHMPLKYIVSFSHLFRFIITKVTLYTSV